jgi:hypothetical protein
MVSTIYAYSRNFSLHLHSFYFSLDFRASQGQFQRSFTWKFFHRNLFRLPAWWNLIEENFQDHKSTDEQMKKIWHHSKQMKIYEMKRCHDVVIMTSFNSHQRAKNFSREFSKTISLFFFSKKKKNIKMFSSSFDHQKFMHEINDEIYSERLICLKKRNNNCWYTFFKNKKKAWIKHRVTRNVWVLPEKCENRLRKQ